MARELHAQRAGIFRGTAARDATSSIPNGCYKEGFVRARGAWRLRAPPQSSARFASSASIRVSNHPTKERRPAMFAGLLSLKNEKQLTALLRGLATALLCAFLRGLTSTLTGTFLCSHGDLSMYGGWCSRPIPRWIGETTSSRSGNSPLALRRRYARPSTGA